MDSEIIGPVIGIIADIRVDNQACPGKPVLQHLSFGRRDLDVFDVELWPIQIALDRAYHKKTHHIAGNSCRQDEHKQVDEKFSHLHIGLQKRK